MIGQFTVLGIALSAVAFYRGRKNVTYFILLDWRWWLVCGLFSILPNKAVLPWLWVGLIYQSRLAFRPKQKFPPHPAEKNYGDQVQRLMDKQS